MNKRELYIQAAFIVALALEVSGPLQPVSAHTVTTDAAKPAAAEKTPDNQLGHTLWMPLITTPKLGPTAGLDITSQDLQGAEHTTFVSAAANKVLPNHGLLFLSTGRLLGKNDKLTGITVHFPVSFPLEAAATAGTITTCAPELGHPDSSSTIQVTVPAFAGSEFNTSGYSTGDIAETEILHGALMDYVLREQLISGTVVQIVDENHDGRQDIGKLDVTATTQGVGCWDNSGLYGTPLYTLENKFVGIVTACDPDTPVHTLRFSRPDVSRYENGAPSCTIYSFTTNAEQAPMTVEPEKQ